MNQLWTLPTGPHDGENADDANRQHSGGVVSPRNSGLRVTACGLFRPTGLIFGMEELPAGNEILYSACVGLGFSRFF